MPVARAITFESDGYKEMGDQDESHERASECAETGELPEQSGGEVKVRYQPTPPRRPVDKKIQPRQPSPPVPEGEDVPDKKPSPPVKLD
jgi:hypothetical protein